MAKTKDMRFGPRRTERKRQAAKLPDGTNTPRLASRSGELEVSAAGKIPLSVWGVPVRGSGRRSN